MRDEAMEIAREYCDFYGLAPLNFELIVTDLFHFQADKDARIRFCSTAWTRGIGSKGAASRA